MTLLALPKPRTPWWCF